LELHHKSLKDGMIVKKKAVCCIIPTVAQHNKEKYLIWFEEK